MIKEKIKSRLQQEGYDLIKEHRDPPNASFPMHDHAGDHIIIVVKGSVEMEMEGKKFLLSEGQELRVPAKVPHDAKMGIEGCEYITGDKSA